MPQTLNAILAENEKKRLSFGLPWLLLFAMFSVWQAGVFSSAGVLPAVKGRLPPGFGLLNPVPVISAGFIISIVFIIVFPGRIVRTLRMLTALALLSALALFLPFNTTVQSFSLLIQLWCCCVMIGFETALITGLFSDRSAIVYLLAACGIVFIPAAVLQSEFANVPAVLINVFNAAALALQLVFYSKLPAAVWPAHVRKSAYPVWPKRLFMRLFVLVVIGSMVYTFGISIAEETRHGIFVFYLSSAFLALTGFFLWRYKRVPPLDYVSVMVVVSILCFLLDILNLFVDILSLPACALLGAGAVVYFMAPYYGVVMARRYPSRFISPAIIAVTFIVSVVIHGILLAFLRNSPIILNIVYIAAPVAAAVLYLFLQPFLLYSLKNSGVEPDKLAQQEPPSQPGHLDHAALDAAAFEHPTERELEVAELMLQGFSYTEIAEQLCIAPSTVISHRKSLYAKMGITAKRELFAKLQK